MKNTNKLISILLVLAMLLSMAPLCLTASAADIEVYATGTLGSGSRTAWTVYDNGLLVIDGKGNSISTKWDSTTASPWKDYADIITRVSFVNCENWECIPEYTFRSLSNLKDVTLPENIEEICQYAFTGTAIETIILPDGLITIGYYAFSSCESLKYININDGVTSIGSGAFYNCSSLKAISIPDSVTSIGQTLFQNCTNLEYVRLSENADKVSGSMFFGCTMLKNVSLPASVTVIGSKAFSNTSNLEGVYYHGINEPTTYNPGINNATFSLAPDTMVIYASNDYSGATMGLKANWENDVQTVTKIEGHFVNIAHTANGAVKVGASIVPTGDTVTIDIMAYKNYELDTITVTDSNGKVELSGSGHSRTFSMPEGDVRISATFKSTATPHVHSWTFAANGATITATCAYADTCHNPISKVEISKGNTSSLTFRPDTAKYMTVSGTMEDVVIPDLVYTLKSTGEPATPINPGVYVASLTIENVTATYEFEITRGNFNYTYFTYTAPQNLTYDGTPKYASVVMSEDYVPYAGEYTVYYNSGTTEPINAGTYTVKVNVAESDYFTVGTAISGRAWRFTIAPKSIEDLTYEGLETSYPVGATPDVTIKHGDMVLVKDTDYTVEYANNTEPGTATMTVTGVGNYTGSKTLEFEISSHTHSFTYSASGDTITAVCENTDGNCRDPEGTLTILAPADLYVDGITAKEVTIENNLVDTSVAIGDITYSTADGSAPKSAGTYTASVTVGGATATVEFTLFNYAAKVTDKDGNAVGTYKTFADAITAAQSSEDSTVTLLDDVTLSAEQDVYSGKFTLDLNGKNLLCENDRVIRIDNGADLTIMDSGDGGTVEVKRNGVYCIYNSGILTIDSGIIKGDGGIDNVGMLNFNGGTSESVTYSAILNSGMAYVYDGILKSSDSGAVHSSGTLYIYGGMIDGVSNTGTAYISGGKIDHDNYAALNLLGGTLEVTGGSFTGTDNKRGYYSGTPYGEYTVYFSEGATLTLKGGEFPNGFVVAHTTANTFLAENYYYKDADGKLIDVADDAKIINGYVKVSKGADLSDAVITVDKTEFVYNGQHQAPAVTVTIGGKTLTENVDYAVNARRWENDVPVQWFYYVDAGVYLSTINGMGDYTGKVEKEFVIKPATVDIIWEGDEFYYTGNPHKVTAKYVDVDGNESNEFELINYVNTDVGVYTATAIFADSNYSATEAATNHTYEIKWYDGAPDATVSGTKGENGWYTSAVTVTAPEGYTISTAVDGAYGNTITFVENEENAVYYLKQTENGYIAKVELGEIKYDLADPAAEITMAENKWNSFFNTVTFGYFFKETQSITITASDETSGIAKIEYFIATEEITDFENAEWIEYTEKFNIEPNSKNIIYAKATDKAGRYVIVNTDGIVLYTDSQAVTSEATYILTSMEDVEFEIDFNGNEVAYVMCGASYLDNTQYTATENGIKLHANYIEIAYTAGEYQFTVYVDPLGENFGYEGIGYDKYIEPHGDTPETITLTLTVKKLDGNVEITNDISKTYDGKAVSAPEYDIIGTGDVTVEYKVKGADDSTYTTEAPVNAGEYTVRVSVAETGKSTSASATKDFTIAKKAVTVTATAPDKVYDGTTDILEYSNVTVEFDGAVEGEMLGFTVGKAWYDTADAGTDKTVHIIYAPVASNNIDNYEFPMNPEYSTDNCYVAAKADITKKAVTVSATVPDRIYGDDYHVDTSKVVITFDGIVEGDDVGYVVTKAYYHVHTVTSNAPVPVVYNVNGVDADNYQFPEFGDYLAPDYGVEATGRVLPRDIANAEITLGDALVYNGTEQTQTVAAVTVDGLEVTYTVSGNKATNVGIYELTIKGNGNFTGEAKVLYEISPDTTSIDAITEENVTSADEKVIKAVKSQIDNAVTDLADDAKKAEYKAIADKCEGLLEKIRDTADDIERIKDAVNSYDESTVTSDDKEDIEEVIEKIENMNPDNLTEEQKTECEEIKAELEALLEEIAEAEAAVAEIGASVEMLDEKRVTIFWKDDIEALKAKIDELLADENMGEAEKAKLNEYKAQAEKLIEIINTPKEYFSLRFFYFIWDCLIWKYNGILWLFSKIFGC